MNISGNITSKKRISGSIYLSGSHVQYYDGEYEVIPKAWESQELETRQKMMREDVLVHEIPYAEVSNIYGTTVTIAS